MGVQVPPSAPNTICPDRITIRGAKAIAGRAHDVVRRPIVPGGDIVALVEEEVKRLPKAPGRDCLFNLIKSTPPTLKYESGIILPEGDLVIVLGRFSNFGTPVNWSAARRQDQSLVSFLSRLSPVARFLT